jgi:hypothetical protein
MVGVGIPLERHRRGKQRVLVFVPVERSGKRVLRQRRRPGFVFKVFTLILFVGLRDRASVVTSLLVVFEFVVFRFCAGRYRRACKQILCTSVCLSQKMSKSEQISGTQLRFDRRTELTRLKCVGEGAAGRANCRAYGEGRRPIGSHGDGRVEKRGTDWNSSCRGILIVGSYLSIQRVG